MGVDYRAAFLSLGQWFGLSVLLGFSNGIFFLISFFIALLFLYFIVDWTVCKILPKDKRDPLPPGYYGRYNKH